jgi:uncharacterized protein (DUF58 family)
MGAHDILSSRQLQTFRKLELTARSVVEGFVTGLHRSPYKGYAVEFAEHRQYMPGDDFKHIDWKLMGKRDRYYVKQYEEDSSLRAYLVVDTSGSMGYKSGKHTKLDYARWIAAVFSHVLLQQNDGVGLITCDSKLNSYLPARNTLSHLRNLTRILRDTRPGEDTGLGNVLHTLATLIKRRALVIIISDFFDSVDEIRLALNHFAHKHHEVILYQVLDRHELNFPFSRLTRFDSLENSYHRVTVEPERLREEYQSQFKDHQRQLQKTCHDLHMDLAKMVTDEPFEENIAKYLTMRGRR